MNILLDTHIIIWWYDSPSKIKKEARKLIEDKENSLFLSAAVIWEMSIKTAIGKLELPKGLVDKAVKDFIELPINISSTRLLATLENIHSDPFDRILISQAVANDFYLMTRDPQIQKYNIKLISA
jgi:PIN domain nuclease of toxin-antitoxin system